MSKQSKPFLVLEDGKWIFKKGKYSGHKLDYVGDTDPGYLKWVHKDAGQYLSDEEFYAVVDSMHRFLISFGR